MGLDRPERKRLLKIVFHLLNGSIFSPWKRLIYLLYLEQVTGLSAAVREEYGTGADPVEPDPTGFREQVLVVSSFYRTLFVIL